MPIDDAGRHSDSVRDLGLDPLTGAIHIGIFLEWAGNRGFIARDDEDAALVRQGRSDTPSAYAARFFVSQFGPWDLTEQGQAFAASGYKTYLLGLGEDPQLFESFDSSCEVPDTWER